jgi:transposase-like protein
MDEELTRFRAAAALENRGRGRMGRRYSAALREQAVRYWVRRRPQGEALPDVATALGVAPWSLQRWVRASRLRPVQIVSPPAAAPVRASLVIVLAPDGVRIEGLDVETTAQLVDRLR